MLAFERAPPHAPISVFHSVIAVSPASLLTDALLSTAEVPVSRDGRYPLTQALGKTLRSAIYHVKYSHWGSLFSVYKQSSHAGRLLLLNNSLSLVYLEWKVLTSEMTATEP